MTDDSPNIPSQGDNPTEYGGGGPGGHAPTPEPEVPRIDSDGGHTTSWQEEQLHQFVAAGAEIPPEMVEEQKAVLLRRGDVVEGRFEVVRQLGFGGMGAVYQVKDRHLGGFKALKVMLPSLLKSETAQKRFLSEISISQRLRHDGIVTVYDLMADRQRRFHFFTMEYIEGKTLHRVLNERGGRLPVSEALDIARQLCDALEYAHQHTIHRDLKPQNVMVQPDGSIKVLDFGLAKLMSPGRLTRSSMALGTAYYQAPEQSIHLSELDQRADIYSVGVILYQMLTGKIPVGAVQAPSGVVKGIPKSLDAVVMRCLQPDAENRFGSAAELREALAAAAGRKKKWVVPAVAVAVLALIAGAVLVLRGTELGELGTVPSGGAPAPPTEELGTDNHLGGFSFGR